MKREFFGVDVPEALERASQKLGIPADDLTYEALADVFHHPTQGDRMGIIVDYDESALVPEVVKDESADEVLALKDDPISCANLVLVKMMEKIGFECRVDATEKDGNVILSVEFLSDKPDMRRGEIRDLRGSLQYLVNRIAGNSRESDLRYIIDFSGDLDARTEVMSSLASELADKAVALGKTVQVQLMDSQDRRLLHTALVDNKAIKTFSDGDGRFRVLCISPAKKTEDDSKKSEEAPKEATPDSE